MLGRNGTTLTTIFLTPFKHPFISHPNQLVCTCAPHEPSMNGLDAIPRTDYRVNLGPTAVTTNVDDYLDELQYCLDAGYRVQAFCRVPGLTNTTIAQDWTMSTPYQVILTRPRLQTQQNKYQLRLEKSILSPRTMHLDNNWGDNHLLNTVRSILNNIAGGMRRIYRIYPKTYLASALNIRKSYRRI